MNPQAKLAEKLIAYRTAILLQFAVMEMASFFSLVAYLLTSDLVFLEIAAVSIVIFALRQPTLQKIVEALQLNQQEKQLLENPTTHIEIN